MAKLARGYIIEPSIEQFSDNTDIETQPEIKSKIKSEGKREIINKAEIEAKFAAAVSEGKYGQEFDYGSPKFGNKTEKKKPAFGKYILFTAAVIIFTAAALIVIVVNAIAGKPSQKKSDDNARKIYVACSALAANRANFPDAEMESVMVFTLEDKDDGDIPSYINIFSEHEEDFLDASIGGYAAVFFDVETYSVKEAYWAEKPNSKKTGFWGTSQKYVTFRKAVQAWKEENKKE